MDQAGKVAKSVLSIVINIALWIFIILIYTIPLLVGFTVRFGINSFVHWRLPNLEPLTPNDVLLVRESLTKQPNVNGGIILRVKGELDSKLFQDHFCHAFLKEEDEWKYQSLYCDIVKVCGYLFRRRLHSASESNTKWWTNHFVVNKFETLAEAKYQLCSWFQTGYKKEEALWGILILTSENESWVAVKGHHALFDGYSFAHILDKLCGFDSALSSDDDSSMDFLKEAFLLFTMPWVAVRYLLRHFWLRDNFDPGLEKLTEVERMPMALASVHLSILKQIRRRLDVHFPSIIYSLQIGALQKFLVASNMEKCLSIETLLSSSFPVRGHPKDRFLNKWSGGTVKIPFRDSNALQRVLETDKSLKMMLSEEGPYLMWKYVSYIPWLFPAFLNYSLSFSNLSLFRYRTSMSCIPQSEAPYQLLGHQVLNVFHAPVMKDSFQQAVLLGCSSTHNQQVDFSLFGHPHFFKSEAHMEDMMQLHFHAELEELARECGVATNLSMQLGNWDVI